MNIRFSTSLTTTIALFCLTALVACSSLQNRETAINNPENGDPSTISQNQSESPWKEVGQLPIPLESHQIIPLGDFVYVLGGWNDIRGPFAEAFFAKFTPDGRLDNWQPTTAKMPLRLQHHAAITHNNALYVLGGDNGFWEGSKVSDRIFRAIPNDQGDITEWVEVGQLPEPRTIHAVTTIGNQVYIFGGSATFRPGSQVVDSIFTATIAEDGTFGEFETLPAFPKTIGWLTATAIDNDIFLVSGKEQFSPTQLTEQIWRSQTRPDDQLTPLESIGTTVPRERHATVQVDRKLIVIAGGGARSVLSRVDAAEVDPQGNLMTWQELPPLPEPRYAHAAFAQGNDIYVSGGFLRYGSNETSRKIFRLRLPQQF